MADFACEFIEPPGLFFPPLQDPTDYAAVIMPHTSVLDESPPTVTKLSPVGNVLGRSHPVVVDIADKVAIRRVNVWVEYPDGSWETAYARGVFAPRFTGSSMTVVQPGMKQTLTLIRRDGWPSPTITVQIEPVDGSGNVG